MHYALKIPAIHCKNNKYDLKTFQTINEIRCGFKETQNKKYFFCVF
jgi:hypothetical protein